MRSADGVFAAPSLGSGIFDYVANKVAPDYSILGSVVTQATAVATNLVGRGFVRSPTLVDLTIGLRVAEEQEREASTSPPTAKALYRML